MHHLRRWLRLGQLCAPRGRGLHGDPAADVFCGAARARACQPAFDAIDMAWPYFLDCGFATSGPERPQRPSGEKLRWVPGGPSRW